MFARTLSAFVAALVVTALTSTQPAAAPPRVESLDTMPGPLYRYYGEHIQEIGGIEHVCWSRDRSDDGGVTWAYDGVYCEPVGFAN